MRTKYSRGALVALCILVPGLAAAGPGGYLRAVQGSPQDVREVAVSYGDLDLTRDQGVAVLYDRLRAAARVVCAPLEAPDLERRALHARCVQQALDGVVAGSANPRLVALHAARAGQSGRPFLRLAKDGTR